MRWYETMSEQILLIDDDLDILEVFGMALETLGHNIITAADGDEGVEMYKKHKPCMVFSDIKMPKIDGYELFSTIHKLDPQSKIIFFTSNDDVVKTLDAKVNGLLDIMHKPVKIKDFDNIIKKYNC